MPSPEKSAELHALHGTEPQSRADAPPVVSGRPRCPKDLSKEARRSFKNLCRLLAARRTLTAGDSEILVIYAILKDRHQKALEHIRAEGEICEYTRLDNHGEQVKTFSKNLWLPIAQECESKMTVILDRLGLTPVNRPRVKPTKSEEDAAITFL